jgi:hypothetical protein
MLRIKEYTNRLRVPEPTHSIVDTFTVNPYVGDDTPVRPSDGLDTLAMFPPKAYRPDKPRKEKKAADKADPITEEAN